MKASVCFLLLAVIGLLSAFAEDVSLATLQAQAAKGDAQSELELGRVYHLGKGVPQDYVKAAGLYRQAAAQGNAKAMHNLGYLYLHGQGVATDIPAAVQWYEKAARLGLAASQLQLGHLYFFGDMGVKQDYGTAIKWFSLAVQPQNAPAQIAPAAEALGAMWENGLGMPKDGRKAVSWYTKAAEMDDARAQANLGRIYFEGVQVKKDPVAAYTWLKLALDQGDISAQHLLPDYRHGNAFSAEQIAQGDRKVREYEEKHPRRLTATIPTVQVTRSPAAANATPTSIPSSQNLPGP